MIHIYIYSLIYICNSLKDNILVAKIPNFGEIGNANFIFVSFVFSVISERTFHNPCPVIFSLHLPQDIFYFKYYFHVDSQNSKTIYEQCLLSSYVIISGILNLFNEMFFFLKRHYIGLVLWHSGLSHYVQGSHPKH